MSATLLSDVLRSQATCIAILQFLSRLVDTVPPSMSAPFTAVSLNPPVLSIVWVCPVKEFERLLDIAVFALHDASPARDCETSVSKTYV